MNKESKDEILKRIKFLSEDADKRQNKIKQEIENLEKICYEIIELQKRIEADEQDNGV